MQPAAKPTSIGDFIIEKKQFKYDVYTDAGNGPNLWTLGRTLQVGQKIIVKRIATTGNVAEDFEGVENSNKVRVLEMTLTEAEVRDIVGPGLPILFGLTAP